MQEPKQHPLEILLNQHGGLTAEIRETFARPDDAPSFSRGARHYVITLFFEARHITFCYSQGSAYKRVSKYDALGTLLSTSNYGETFDDWCFSFGANNDSIKALKTYEACTKKGKDVKFLLGKHLKEAIEIVQEL